MTFKEWAIVAWISEQDKSCDRREISAGTQINLCSIQMITRKLLKDGVLQKITKVNTDFLSLSQAGENRVDAAKQAIQNSHASDQSEQN